MSKVQKRQNGVGREGNRSQVGHLARISDKVWRRFFALLFSEFPTQDTIAAAFRRPPSMPSSKTHHRPRAARWPASPRRLGPRSLVRTTSGEGRGKRSRRRARFPKATATEATPTMLACVELARQTVMPSTKLANSDLQAFWRELSHRIRLFTTCGPAFSLPSSRLAQLQRSPRGPAAPAAKHAL